jgi:hypothetical protein
VALLPGFFVSVEVVLIYLGETGKTEDPAGCGHHQS